MLLCSCYSCAWNPSKARAAHCTHRARSDATQDVALSLLHFAQKRILSLTLPPCCHLCPPLHRPEDEGRDFIRVETRVAIAVRFCAGASYLDLQDIHGVSRTACYACFHQVVDAIVKCRSQIGAMKFPEHRMSFRSSPQNSR